MNDTFWRQGWRSLAVFLALLAAWIFVPIANEWQYRAFEILVISVFSATALKSVGKNVADAIVSGMGSSRSTGGTAAGTGTTDTAGQG